jgi:hypothetical protein
MCADLRDRAYSLISVSYNSDALEMDYGWSLVVLVKRVLDLKKTGVCTHTVINVLQVLGCDIVLPGEG